MEHRPWPGRQAAGETLPPLARARSFDVAVVGGGYVGLQTALRIKAEAPRMGVAVLERDSCGAAARGRRRGPPGVFAAIGEPRGGSLSPPGLAAALRDEALAAGVEIFERTPVTGLRGGAGPRLETSSGAVRAGAVVLATNAWAA